ncbi:amino acid adenylation domain-containing protein [Roseateles sp. 22389]|uniref:non-ribosomal peptide synthetase n=1 Tax=Roseateles sp. 22389 TaxID=3453916 RepID=UPI003F831B14
MNAIHTPEIAAAALASSGLSPEQRAVALADPSAALTAWVRIDGPLDVVALRWAVEQAVAEHDLLRTAFGAVDGYRGLRQWSLPATPVLDWQGADLRDADMADSTANSTADGADEREGGLHGRGEGVSALHAWLGALATPLAIDEGRVVRAGLARLGEARHVLAVHASALVVDAGSLIALLARVAEIATADAIGTEHFQYAQYVDWRAELASDDGAQAGNAYWQRHFAGTADDAVAASTTGAVGVVRALNVADWQAPRLAEPLAPRAGRVQARAALPADLVRRLTDANANGDGDGDASAAGPERLLHAVWLLLLARLNGFEPFVAGWRHDCRADYDLMRGGMGLFEKILPMAMTPRPEARFSNWLAHCAAIATNHVDAQEYWPVDAPPTTAHREAVFGWREAVPPAAGWSAPEVELPESDVALSLDVHWGPRPELALSADGTRHSRAAVERLLCQFTTLLRAALDRPKAAMHTLDPVGEAERAALLAWRGERRDVGTLTISQHVAEWAALSPQAPAVEAQGETLDYRSLNQRANRLARAMTALGVTPGALVALNLPRSADLIVAILATWRAGAAYLPLEPHWPEARRQALLADARPALVLHAASLGGMNAVDAVFRCREAVLAGESLSPAGDPVLDLRTLDADMPPSVAGLGDLAYVLYTSGSTGQPKGVAIEHGQLLHYVVGSSAAMDLAASRRWALTSSVVADLGNTALFGALFNGACLVIAEDADTRDADAFACFVDGRGIDAIKIVPSHLEALLDARSPRLPRTVVLGGEAAPRALIERIWRLAPDTVIHNHYGPTETTVGVLVHRVRPSDARGADALPLTQVLPNTRVHVLDEAMRLVPAGAQGQVHVGGPQLCRGYLGREVPGVFVDDPFRPGERLYRTGDVAQVLAEGGLRLVGRADHQLKLRGFRVDPAEIEGALLTLPGVRQAVVLGIPGAGGIELTACVAMAEDGAGLDVGIGGLREALKSLLPSHMVPARVMRVDDFPRLPNGKLDRAAIATLVASALTSPSTTTATSTSSVVVPGALGALDALSGTSGPTASVQAASAGAPRDALESVLSQGMGLLLGRGPIGIDEDFFGLGGHSLLVIRLVARLRKLLGIEIEPGLVFDHPTVAELAAALRAGPWDTSGFERLAATDWQTSETAGPQTATSETATSETAASETAASETATPSP